MSSRLTVRNVRLIAAERSYSFDFNSGVNLIVGPVGVGKTSLLELIRFGLGGSAMLSQAVQQVGRQLALTIDVSDHRYLLLRGIASHRNRVTAYELDGRRIADLSVSNPSDEGSISHFLMSRLSIPEVRVPTSRRKLASRYTTVSFNDVFNYVYIPQTEIDRSTANHLDGVRDPKRRSTFEVVYGLIDTQVAEIQLELGQLAERITQAKSAIRDIETFIAQVGAPSANDLDARLRADAAVITAKERQLELVRSEMRAVTQSASMARESAESLLADLTDAAGRRERAAQQTEELMRLRAQLSLDEQRTIRSMMAGSKLAAIEFQTCPRCLQRVNDRDVPGGHCSLCTQPEPTTEAVITLEDELERLRGQFAETDQLCRDAEDTEHAAALVVDRLKLAIAEARAKADTEARESVSPFVDQVASLSQEVGILRGRQGATQQSLRVRQQLSVRAQQLQDLIDTQATLGDRLDIVQSELEVGHARVEELSEAFDEILRDFQLPWYEPSYIDRVTYLPMVGGKRLEALSSGGMKTLVNDAYFLAGLTYALRAPRETHLPRLAIIDTPRKNFGSDPEDRGAADRIYRWLRRLQDQYFADAFQLIVADNDLPSEARSFPVRRLSYEAPLIDDLPHPGPDAVATLTP